MAFQEIKQGDLIIRVAREDKEWLGAIDIIDSAPVKIKIKSIGVDPEAVFKEGRKQRVVALTFEGTKKKLALNATNAKTLTEKYGRRPEDIAGKVITLEVEPLKREYQGYTHGIRIV